MYVTTAAGGALGGALGGAWVELPVDKPSLVCCVLPSPPPSPPCLQYLTAVSDPRGGEECMDDNVYREG